MVIMAPELFSAVAGRRGINVKSSAKLVNATPGNA
jgi:hypothetical protein